MLFFSSYVSSSLSAGDLCTSPSAAGRPILNIPGLSWSGVCCSMIYDATTVSAKRDKRLYGSEIDRIYSVVLFPSSHWVMFLFMLQSWMWPLHWNRCHTWFVWSLSLGVTSLSLSNTLVPQLTVPALGTPWYMSRIFSLSPEPEKHFFGFYFPQKAAERDAIFHTTTLAHGDRTIGKRCSQMEPLLSQPPQTPLDSHGIPSCHLSVIRKALEILSLSFPPPKTHMLYMHTDTTLISLSHSLMERIQLSSFRKKNC